jgi:hypothetical protein
MASRELTAAVAQFSRGADDERWPLLYTCLFVVGSSTLLWTMIIAGARLLMV